ncbi:hypothetical protein NQ317_012035, partial [Molorchus minor]
MENWQALLQKQEIIGKKKFRADWHWEKTSSLIATNKFMKEQNPFRYDSSDDEDETSAIPNREQSTKSSDNLSREANISKNTYWSEPFFFKHDDYRLQEGFDFIEKMRTEEKKTEFSKLRRDLKEIVKAKVRNVQRKNRPFKKKLGGSKRKKMIRMKKALKDNVNNVGINFFYL